MVMINPMMSVSRFDGADREGRRGAGLWRILRSQALSRDLQDREPGLSGAVSWLLGSDRDSRSGPALQKILLDGNPHKIPRMVPTRDWAPPSFPTRLTWRATSSATFGDRDRRASTAAINSGVPFGRARGCFGGPVGVWDRPDTPRLAAVSSRSCQGFTRTGNHAARNQPMVPTSFVTPRMQDRVWGTSRRCGGGFAK
jgi:hypothetical protein